MNEQNPGETPLPAPETIAEKVPAGPTCDCDTCRGQRVLNQERLSSTDRLAWLESQVLQLRTEIAEIKNLFQPQRKSLEVIRQEIEEATELGE